MNLTVFSPTTDMSVRWEETGTPGTGNANRRRENMRNSWKIIL